MGFTGELFALLTAVLWSGSALIFAAVTMRITSVQVNILRLVIAEAYFGLWVLVWHLPFSLSLSQVVLLALSGIVGLTLGDTFLFRAFQEIGARISMLLMTLAPAIGAGLAAVFLHESLGIWSVVGMLVTLSGVAIVMVERSPAGGARFNISVRGIVLGLLAAAGQGIGLILAKAAFREGAVDSFVATAVRIFAGLCILLPVAVVTDRRVFPAAEFRKHPWTLWLLMLGALLGPFLGISTSLMAITWTSVGVASTIMSTVPVIMLPLARIFYGEKIHGKSILGAVIAVAGVSFLFIQ
ncbi:MAG: DMT family transporter [Bacteroidota bacterium]